MQADLLDQIFYETINRLSQANELDKLVTDLSSYLIKENQKLNELGFNQEYLEIFFYALAALSDHWILNKVIKDKYIPNEAILEYSIEVKMFSTAEAGSKLLENTRFLLGKEEQVVLKILGIYLKVLTILSPKDKVLMQAVSAKIYPKQISATDPFNCKTRISIQNSLIRYLGIKSIVMSTSLGYLIISTCAWKYGTYELRHSLHEQNRISLKNSNA